jgi:hypothetical protein
MPLYVLRSLVTLLACGTFAAPPVFAQCDLIRDAWERDDAAAVDSDREFGVELDEDVPPGPYGPYARERGDIDWQSFEDWYLDYVVPGDDDRIVHEHGWRTDAPGFEEWSAQAQRDWGSYGDAGNEDWFDF